MAQNQPLDPNEFLTSILGAGWKDRKTSTGNGNDSTTPARAAPGGFTLPECMVPVAQALEVIRSTCNHCGRTHSYVQSLPSWHHRDWIRPGLGVVYVDQYSSKPVPMLVTWETIERNKRQINSHHIPSDLPLCCYYSDNSVVEQCVECWGID